MGSSTPGLLFRKGIFGCVLSASGDAAGPASVSVSTSGGLISTRVSGEGSQLDSDRAWREARVIQV